MRIGGRPTSENSHRIDECLKGEHNIKDELDEVIVLSNGIFMNVFIYSFINIFHLIYLFTYLSNIVSLLIGEWIPFGSNQIIALIDKLGASERVKGTTSFSLLFCLCIVLFYFILFYFILFYFILFYFILFYIILYYIILYYIILLFYFVLLFFGCFLTLK